MEVSENLDSDKTLYIYYDNSTVSGVSDGDDTFIFIDHFPGTSLNATKWTTDGSPTVTVSGSICKVESDYTGWRDAIHTATSLGPYNIAIRTNASLRTNQKEGLGFSSSVSPSNNFVGLNWKGSNQEHFKTAKSSSVTTTEINDGAWHIFDLTWKSGKAICLKDGSTAATHTTNIPTSALNIYGGVQKISATATVEIDWVLVRKWLETEPSIDAWGSEEEEEVNNAVTTYEYDDLNRLVKTTFPDGYDETLTYDNVGNVISRLDPNGNSINYTYDALNRLTAITYPNSSTVTYTYNGAGNRLTMEDPGSKTYYHYNARNWLTNKTKVIDSTAYTKLYTYDKTGNILTLTYPDSFQLTYTYDALDRVKTAGSYAAFTYTLDDEVSTITYGNDVKTTYSYDSRSRPTRILTKFNALTLLDLNYTYDGEGNVLSINMETYGYDDLDRLTSSSGPWGSISYTYDVAGNRLTKTEGGTTTYTYGPYNRLTKAGDTTFTYDANGNLATKNDGTDSWTYSYDYENRLTQVEKNSQTIAQYVYDGDGQRIKKTESNITEVHIHQGLSTIYQKFTGNGTIIKRIYGGGVHIAEVRGGAKYLHQDVLGSTRVVSDSNGTVKFSSNYKPFGPSHGQTGSETFKYTGKPEDSATGLYYFGARYYDPEVGRFITQDPGMARLKEPQTLNRYIYSVNNPLRYVDPDGADHTTTEDRKDFLDLQFEYAVAFKLTPRQCRYIMNMLILMPTWIYAPVELIGEVTLLSLEGEYVWTNPTPYYTAIGTAAGEQILEVYDCPVRGGFTTFGVLLDMYLMDVRRQEELQAEQGIAVTTITTTSTFVPTTVSDWSPTRSNDLLPQTFRGQAARWRAVEELVWSEEVAPQYSARWRFDPLFWELVR